MKKLVILIPSTGEFLHKKFFTSFMNVIDGRVTRALSIDYGVEATVKLSSLFPIDANRNNSIDKAINELHADYIFFADNDMTFPPDTLIRLFECISDEFPVVTGIYCKKTPPYDPIIGRYSSWDDVGQSREELEAQGLVYEDKQLLYYRPIHIFDNTYPFQVDMFGPGCSLYKSSVFEKLRQPYFKYLTDIKTGLNTISEDSWFCAQLKKSGIKVLCDPRVRCGHFTEFEVTTELMTQMFSSGMRDQINGAALNALVSLSVRDVKTITGQ